MPALSVPTVPASLDTRSTTALLVDYSAGSACGLPSGDGGGTDGWDGAVEPAASVADAELGLHLPAHADLIRAGDVGQARCSSQYHRLRPARERCLHRQHAEGTLATRCRQHHRRRSVTTRAVVIDGGGGRSSGGGGSSGRATAMRAASASDDDFSSTGAAC